MQQSLQANNHVSKVLAIAPNTYFLSTKKHHQPMNPRLQNPTTTHLLNFKVAFAQISEFNCGHSMQQLTSYKDIQYDTS